MVNIIIADRKPHIRSALRLLLEQEPDFAVCGEAAHSDALLRLLQHGNAHIVLFEWELSGCKGLYFIHQLGRLYPSILIVALSTHQEVAEAALAAGASAFISKSDPPQRVLATIRQVSDRLSWVV